MAETKEIDAPEREIYELGYHIVPTVGEDKLAEVVAGLKAILERDGGTFLMDEYPVLMSLAYTMVKTKTGHREKHSTAYFGWIKFELESRHIGRLKEDLDQHDSILRYLLITTVKEDTRAPKRVLVREGGSAPISKPHRAPEKAVPVSEEELDRSIAHLVVE